VTDPRDDEFTDFVADHGARLLRTACLVTGDRHLGEDLLQTALAKRLRRPRPTSTLAG
jgi:DNA-directed RNA polymerase specialized sigma24 family protein